MQDARLFVIASIPSPFGLGLTLELSGAGPRATLSTIRRLDVVVRKVICSLPSDATEGSPILGL